MPRKCASYIYVDICLKKLIIFSILSMQLYHFITASNSDLEDKKYDKNINAKALKHLRYLDLTISKNQVTAHKQRPGNYLRILSMYSKSNYINNRNVFDFSCLTEASNKDNHYANNNTDFLKALHDLQTGDIIAENSSITKIILEKLIVDFNQPSPTTDSQSCFSFLRSLFPNLKAIYFKEWNIDELPKDFNTFFHLIYNKNNMQQKLNPLVLYVPDPEKGNEDLIKSAKLFYKNDFIAPTCIITAGPLNSLCFLLNILKSNPPLANRELAIIIIFILESFFISLYTVKVIAFGTIGKSCHFEPYRAPLGYSSKENTFFQKRDYTVLKILTLQIVLTILIEFYAKINITTIILSHTAALIGMRLLIHGCSFEYERILWEIMNNKAIVKSHAEYELLQSLNTH